MLLQESFKYADVLLKNNCLYYLIVMHTVALLSIFVETATHFVRGPWMSKV